MITNIVGGKVWLKGKVVEADISIQDDRITAIGKSVNLPKGDRVFDASGKVVLPGLIDVHAHLRDFEQSYKEDFTSGTSAAVAGGFTFVLDMPNTKPPITTPERLRAKFDRAQGRLFCDVGFYTTPRSPEYVTELVRAGCIALKAYMTKSLDGERYDSGESLYELMKKASSAGLVLCVHAEDPSYTMHSSKASPYSHARAHSVKAEERGVDMAIRAAERAKGKLHICHLSTYQGMRIIRRAKRNGLSVSCEATPHHTTLTTEAFRRFGRRAITEPPLRSKKHVEAILMGIARGDVDILATDHAPHALAEKDGDTPPPGFPGFETALPVLFTLVREGRISLSRVVDALTLRAAKRFSLPDVGEIKVGKLANLTIVDLKAEGKVDPSRFYTKAKFSPFSGMVVKAKNYATFVRGEEVFHDGELTASPGVGRVVHGAEVRR